MGVNNTQVACLDINLSHEKKKEGEKERGREGKMNFFKVIFTSLSYLQIM